MEKEFSFLFWKILSLDMGFPGGSASKESTCNAGDLVSIPRVGKIPWRRKWRPTQVFLPGKFHGQRRLVGYSPWSCKELDTTERLTLILHWTWNSIFFFLLVHIECIVSHDKSTVTVIFIPIYINAPSLPAPRPAVLNFFSLELLSNCLDCNFPLWIFLGREKSKIFFSWL